MDNYYFTDWYYAEETLVEIETINICSDLLFIYNFFQSISLEDARLI